MHRMRAIDDSVISDDEVLGQSDVLLQFLEKKLLPTEIQVLYGFHAIGEGGRNFLALGCLKKIYQLLPRTLTESAADFTDTFLDPSDSRMLFWLSAKSRLDQQSSLALLAEILESNRAYSKFAESLKDMFTSHLNEFKSVSDFQGTSIEKIVREAEKVKIIIACAKLRIVGPEQVALSKSTASGSLPKEASQEALVVVDMLLEFRSSLWSGFRPGNGITNSSIELVQLLWRAFQIQRNVDLDAVEHVFRSLQKVVSLIFECELDLDHPSEQTKSINWTTLPISSSWQDSKQQELSRMCYNFCVSLVVFQYHGWSKDEFTPAHLGNRLNPGFMGIRVHNGRVHGFISDETEIELCMVWAIASHLQQLADIDLLECFRKVKSETWYEATMNQLKSLGDNEVSSFAEKEALCLLLMFSHFALRCGLACENECKGKLFEAAISVLLPLAQFCVTEDLWDSNIGKKAVKPEELYVLENIMTASRTMIDRKDSSGVSAMFQPSNNGTVTPRTRSRRNASARNDDEEFNWDQIQNFVKVSVEVLDQEWKKASDHQELVTDSQPTTTSIDAMQRLNVALSQLKGCCTLQGIQKASISVSIALLDLARLEQCSNPFHCLHHAASFASHGPRGGDNDEPFRATLPDPNECTALEALMILARADCLHGIHFVEEAVFLCSFVARVCKNHRQTENAPPFATTKWRVVSIQTYTTSVFINSTIDWLREHDERKVSGLGWDVDVREELKKGRIDAQSVSGTVISSTENYLCEVGQPPSELVQNSHMQEPSFEQRIDVDEGDIEAVAV